MYLSKRIKNKNNGIKFGALVVIDMCNFWFDNCF